MAAQRLMFLLLAILLAGCTSNGSTATPTAQTLTISGRTFTLDLALDPESRFKGLGGRKSIPDDGGMLFVFEHAQPLAFVMRDCPVPIDLIFLGPDGRVVAMHAMQPEPGVEEVDLKRYASRWNAQFAIELKGGTLEQLNLSVDDPIDLPVDELKALAR
ncbi:MAG: DUF192 domain-containing protein [Phycisphaeraceae bacterium]|nr:DUF192 domain-containing protein [Phycisphaeraceae bacterium]